MKKVIALFQKELLDVEGLAESTVETYVSSISAFCDFAEKNCNIDPLDAAGHHLLDWFRSIKPRISSSRLRQHQFGIKKFFTFLEKHRIIRKNPAASLSRLGGKYGDKHTAVPADTVFKLLDAVSQTSWMGKRNHLIIALLWCLGLRISELTGLTVGNFEPSHDPQNRIGLLRIRGKNKKQRALFVVDGLYDELCAYLAHDNSPQNKDQPLFPVEQGKAISDNRIQKLFQEYGGKAKLTVHLTPHRLRHSFATEMYCQSVPFSAIQAMLGHTRKAETAVYVHVPDNMKQRALAEISLCGGDRCR
jgi:integrase/recombinase XerD